MSYDIVRMCRQKVYKVTKYDGETEFFDALMNNGHVKTIWEKYVKVSKCVVLSDIGTGWLVTFKHNKRTITAVVSPYITVYRYSTSGCRGRKRQYRRNEYQELYELTPEGVALLKQAIVEDRI